MRSKTAVIWTVLIFMAVFWFAASRSTAEGGPKAESGVLDLTKWNFADNGNVQLDGEWEYYRDQFLSPDDFDLGRHSGKTPEMTGYVRVPDRWERYTVGGREASPFGYATFRLHVKLEESSGRIFGIRQVNIKTAHKLFVNGKEIGARGIPGTNTRETVSVNAPYVRFFSMDGNSAEIIVQVANFSYGQGGITHAISLGYQEDIQSVREFAVIDDLFGAYFITLFRMRGRDRSWFYFGLCCIAVCLYLVSHGEKIAAIPLPEFPYELFSKIQTLSGAAAELFLLLYAMHSFPNLFKKIVMKGFGAIIAARMLLILLTTASVYSQLSAGSYLLTFAEILYIAYVMALGMARRMEGAGYMLIGALSLMAIDIVSAMDVMGIASVFSIQMAAWLCFIIAQGLFLSKRFVNAFSTIEKLSERLHSLDRLKDEFLANTSHEMKTPLHGVINIAQSLLEGAAGQMSPLQEENVAMIAATGRRMSNLVNDLLDFSKLKNGELVLKRQAVALRPVVRVIFEMFRYLAGDKPVRFIDRLNDRLFLMR